MYFVYQDACQEFIEMNKFAGINISSENPIIFKLGGYDAENKRVLYIIYLSAVNTFIVGIQANPFAHTFENKKIDFVKVQNQNNLTHKRNSEMYSIKWYLFIKWYVYI